eukprot:5576802-Pyramimonas_sp.AAC.1
MQYEIKSSYLFIYSCNGVAERRSDGSLTSVAHTVALNIHMLALNIHTIALNIHMLALNIHTIALNIHVTGRFLSDGGREPQGS